MKIIGMDEEQDDQKGQDETHVQRSLLDEMKSPDALSMFLWI